MPYSYKTSIAFGLVYIPVKLHAAVKNNDIGFNMLDKSTMSRVKYKKTCVACDGREVKQEDIIRGYEYEKNKYVLVSDEELEKLKTKKDKNITIEKFVDLSEIDSVYYDKSYHVEATGAEKAFALLLEAMEKQNKAGLAKSMLGSKESLIIIRAAGGRMLLSTLFFEDEVQKPGFSGSGAQAGEKELALAENIIGSMSGSFDPAEFRDEYRIRLMSALEAKIAGEEIEIPVQPKETPVSDLMDALQKSLMSLQLSGDTAGAGKKPAVSAAAYRRAGKPRMPTSGSESRKNGKISAAGKAKPAAKSAKPADSGKTSAAGGKERGSAAGEKSTKTGGTAGQKEKLGAAGKSKKGRAG